MAPEQKDNLYSEIYFIKQVLDAEKKKFGEYEDINGFRYLPPKYYLQLEDYTGGLSYINWFYANFPDDPGFPDFLFVCTILLYKNGELKEAKKKAFETFYNNTYFFDRYFGRPIIPIDKWEGSDIEKPSFTAYLDYTSSQPKLADFTEWLDNLVESGEFKEKSAKFIAIKKLLATETDVELRHYLIMAARKMEKESSYSQPIGRESI